MCICLIASCLCSFIFKKDQFFSRTLFSIYNYWFMVIVVMSILSPTDLKVKKMKHLMNVSFERIYGDEFQWLRRLRIGLR